MKPSAFMRDTLKRMREASRGAEAAGGGDFATAWEEDADAEGDDITLESESTEAERGDGPLLPTRSRDDMAAATEREQRRRGGAMD